MSFSGDDRHSAGDVMAVSDSNRQREMQLPSACLDAEWPSGWLDGRPDNWQCHTRDGPSVSRRFCCPVTSSCRSLCKTATAWFAARCNLGRLEVPKRTWVSARTKPARLPLQLPPIRHQGVQGRPQPTCLWTPACLPFSPRATVAAGRWCFHVIGQNTYTFGAHPPVWRLNSGGSGSGQWEQGPWPPTPGSSAVWSSGGDDDGGGHVGDRWLLNISVAPSKRRGRVAREIWYVAACGSTCVPLSSSA